MEKKEIKKPHEYWYFFPYSETPKIIHEGAFPKEPYKKFDSYGKCLEYCNKRKLFNVIFQWTNNKNSFLLN